VNVVTINSVFEYEVCHYYSSNIEIYSCANKIHYKDSQRQIIIHVPVGLLIAFLSSFRIIRRLLRLDKMNVLPVDTGVVILYRGFCYIYSFQSNILTKTLKLRNCRNILHNAITRCSNGDIYFGEYGSNYDYKKVPIYVSKDNGESWKICFEFESREIRHIHGVFEDIYTNTLWVCTGDTNNESKIIQTNFDFSILKIIGSGSQDFRTCSIFFSNQYVYWNMDSHIDDSYSIVYNRSTGVVEKCFRFPGPVIYTKQFEDGYFMTSTSQEVGPSVKDNLVHVYLSTNFKEWIEVIKFEHDGFNKKYFKFGLVGFSLGAQTTNDFTLFCEAVKEYDGKVLLCSFRK
jgi:hypothetical protein